MLQSIIKISTNERPKRIRHQCKYPNTTTYTIPTKSDVYTNTEIISSDIGTNTNINTQCLIDVSTSTITPKLVDIGTSTTTPKLVDIGTSTTAPKLVDIGTSTTTPKLVDIGINTIEHDSIQAKNSTKQDKTENNENKLLAIIRNRNKVALAQKKFMASINKDKTKPDVEYDTDE